MERLPVPQGLPKTSEIVKKDQDLQDFVQGLFDLQAKVSNDGSTLQEVFQKITHIHEFVVLFKDHIAVQAAIELPEVVKALAKKAKTGDVQAAKLLNDIANVQDRNTKQVPSTAIQINITTEQRGMLEGDFVDVTS